MGSRVPAGLTCLLLAACVTLPAGIPVRDPVTVRIGVYPNTLLSQLQPLPPSGAERTARLYDLFGQVGCDRLEARADDSIVCTLFGEIDDTIVVGADVERAGHRQPPDDWFAAAMLPTLVKSMGVEPRRHTFEFIGLTDGARTQVVMNPGRTLTSALRTKGGIHEHLNRIPKEERGRLVAAVNLRGYRQDPTRARDRAADPNLSLDLYSVSRTMEVPYGQLATVGAASSGRHGVPTIEILVAGLQVGEYLDSYRLVAFYLGYLDQTLELRRRTVGAATGSSAALRP